MAICLCLVGETGGPADEGARNVFEAVTKNVPSDVSHVDISNSPLLWPANMVALHGHRPEVMISLSGPSVRGLMGLKFLGLLANRPYHISVGLHPMIDWRSKFAQTFRPDRFLALSGEALRRARASRIQAQLFYLGVDRSRFRAARPLQRERIRETLGIPASSHVVLHVGHWKTNRNLHQLADIAKAGHKVMLVTSSRFPPIMAERGRLEKAGVSVVHGFTPAIHAFYQAADVYMSTVTDPRGAIEQPLTVLEALATELPVIAYPVGGVVDLARRYGGIHIPGQGKDALALLEESRETGLEKPRVLPPDWRDVTQWLVSEAMHTSS